MRLAFAAVAAVALGTAVRAQPAATAGPGPAAPVAVVGPGGGPVSTGALAPGANSFTEGQARARIEARGFSDVTDLREDDRGIWHAVARHGGRRVEVMLDYRGNIASK